MFVQGQVLLSKKRFLHTIFSAILNGRSNLVWGQGLFAPLILSQPFKKFPDNPDHSGYNLKFNLEIFILKKIYKNLRINVSTPVLSINRGYSVDPGLGWHSTSMPEPFGMRPTVQSLECSEVRLSLTDH